MATLGVPGTYSTISAAVAAAFPGDTILVAAGYAGNEAVSVTINDLTFSAPSSVPGIVLTAAAGIVKITLADASPIQIVGNVSNNNLTGNSGANVISDGGGGNDTLRGGGGNDTITVTGGTDTVDGGGGTGDLLVVDYSTATASVSSSSASVTDSGTRTVNFQNVERLQVTGGSGDDGLVGLSGNDVLSGGDGNDTIYSSDGTDTLSGGAGNDIFQIYGGGAGTVDGGTGTDTVQGYDLGSFSFSNVEVLDAVVGGGTVYATMAQLGSFGSITASNGAADSAIMFYLQGAGGTLDLSTVDVGTHTLYVADNGVTSGYSVTGAANGDTIGGSSYDDTLDGGAGDDTIYSSGGTDTLRGGAGNDVFGIGTGAGTVDGGTATDTVRSNDLGTVSFSNVEVLDVYYYGGISATVAQLASFGSITTSYGAADSQIGLNLRGAGGTLDLSTVDVGAHTLYVADNGVTSGYSVTGAANGDTIGGSSYDDTLDGGAGDDTIYGSGGTDTLRGGAGNDVFQIGTGAGTVDGGTATDTVRSNDLGTVSFSNVEVLDVYYYGGVSATVAQLASFGSITTSYGAVDSQIALDLRGAGGTLDLSTVDVGAHTLYVTDAGLTSGVTVTGTANGDWLQGSSYDDTLDGGAGNDTIYNSGGTDTLKGGAGNDIFQIYNGGAGTVDGGTDTDTVEGYDLGSFSFSNVEMLDAYYYGSVYATVVQLASFGSISTSYGAADSQIGLNLRGAGGTLNLSTVDVGAHTLYVADNGVTSGYSVTGAANGDIIAGSSYDDTLDGGAGDDTIYSSEGTDTLRGGAGNDIFQINTGAGTVDGGTGTDTVQSNDLGSVSFGNVEVLDAYNYGNVYATVVQLASFGSVTTSYGAADSQIALNLRGAGGTLDLSTVDVGAHSVYVDGTGLTSGLTVIGTANGDWLQGSSYDDTLNGGAGDDSLSGGAGINVLDGGDGNDTIYGSEGTDTLSGGAGNDIFEIYDGGTGTVDGGTGTDTVKGYDLGSVSFSNVEVLDAYNTNPLKD